LPTTSLDVVAIGNAIVDVLSQTDDAFLARHGLEKGAMTLIDAAQAESLYAETGPGIKVSGGSAANTAAGLASLGGTAAFIGKVRDDELGKVFTHDLRAAGVAFEVRAATSGPPTARSLILVTPDAQRTMNTFLGACTDLLPTDVDAERIAAAKITYLEGYLWDRDDAKDSFRKAATAARDAGRKVAFTLSDKFCVERWRDEFLDLINSRIDILFANEAEILSLYETGDWSEACAHVRGHVEVAALTRSEKGSVLLHDGEIHIVDAEPVAHVVDTTGAGDLYAAGVLYGIVTGEDLDTSGRIGAICAAEVISHFGARPETSLSNLVAAKLER
jgi:sugar/nucleoside kinase (ribokinase family)